MKLREEIAKQLHENWASFMKYVIKVATLSEDGALKIPQTQSNRWIQASYRKFDNLHEYEQISYMDEADKIIAITAAEMKKAQASKIIV